MGPIKFTLIKKLPRNRRFNYTPMYYKGKENVDASNYDTKFDAYADNYSDNDVSNHWHEARVKGRNRNNSGFNSTIWVLIVLLTLIFLFLIDFDLTIFLP